MIHNVDPQLSQWDVGRSVSISDSEATHIHFANQGDSKAVIIEIENGSAKIPDYLLQTGKTVIAYSVKDGVTLESKSFPVRKREKPENYVYEDDQRNYIYNLITDAETAVANANLAVESANEAAEGANLATANANVATSSASLATTNANNAAENANLAANNTNEAITKANNAVKNMMVVGEAQGENISLDNAIDQTLVGLRVFGKTTQDGTPTPDAPVELVNVGDSGSIDVMVVGKNLLKTTAVSASNMNGVSFTVNGDGSITANGTATVDTYFTVNESVYVGNGEYYLTGCPTGGSVKTYFLYISGLVQDFGNGVRSKLSGRHKIGICIAKASTVSNLTFYPMIRPVSVTDGVYEPHRGQTMAIETPNGLPGIPVTSGGNYTDANGQQWVCDEIDFARGIFIKRVAAETLSGSPDFREASDWPGRFVYGGFLQTMYKDGNQMSFSNFAKWRRWALGEPGGSCFAVTSKLLYYYPATTMTETEVNELFAEMISSETPPVILAQLATPIETPLSEEELAAYANLHTYKGNTTVSNDAGAWMDLEYVMDAKKYIDSLVTGWIAPARVE